MSVGASLKVKKIEGREHPWLVDVPATISETGKRQRRFFATKQEALNFADRRKEVRDTIGVLQTGLDAADLRETAAAKEILAPYKATIMDAVRFYVTTQERLKNTVPLGTAWAAFRASKGWPAALPTSRPKRTLGRYAESHRHTSNRFAGLHESPLTELSHVDLESVLNKLPGPTRNSDMRNLRAVLNFGIKKGWLDKNPIARMDFAKIKKADPVTLDPEICVNILEYCRAESKDVLAYHVLALFCGIRPAELGRLSWAEVHADEKYVDLPPRVTKSGRRRTVDLSDNAVAWLALCDRKEPICPTVKTLSRRLSDVRTSLGYSEENPWPQDAMRHTFASCWLAEHHDINRLTLMMGHRGTQVLFEHYHRCTRPEIAKAFWAIVPKQ